MTPALGSLKAPDNENRHIYGLAFKCVPIEPFDPYLGHKERQENPGVMSVAD